MSVSSPLGSLRKESMVPPGSFLKASSVGAKTVKDPDPLRLTSSCVAFNAVTRVVNRPSATRASMMVVPAAGVGVTVITVVTGTVVTSVVTGALVISVVTVGVGVGVTMAGV